MLISLPEFKVRMIQIPFTVEYDIKEKIQNKPLKEEKCHR